MRERGSGGGVTGVARRAGQRMPPGASGYNSAFRSFRSRRPARAPAVAGNNSGGSHASHAHHRGEGRAPCGQRDFPRRPRPRPAHRHREGAEGLRERDRPRRRARDRRHAARRLSGPRDPRRGRHRQGRQRRRRERLDHRPARRHHQLPARVPAVLRVDRARAEGTGDAGGDLRPGAQRPLHRDARPRRLSQRPPHARVEARASARLPHRYGLSRFATAAISTPTCR